MQIDLGQGNHFYGTALEIVARMHSVAFGVEELRLAEYIDWVLERAATLEDVHIHVAPGSLAERAEQLLRGLVAAGLARDLEADADVEEDERTTMRWCVAADLSSL